MGNPVDETWWPLVWRPSGGAPETRLWADAGRFVVVERVHRPPRMSRFGAYKRRDDNGGPIAHLGHYPIDDPVTLRCLLLALNGGMEWDPPKHD